MIYNQISAQYLGFGWKPANQSRFLQWQYRCVISHVSLMSRLTPAYENSYLPVYEFQLLKNYKIVSHLASC